MEDMGKMKAEMRHCCKLQSAEGHREGGAWDGFSSTASEGPSHCLDCDAGRLVSKSARQKCLFKPLLLCAGAAPAGKCQMSSALV